MTDEETESLEMTILAVRIPKELRERIKAAAIREDRTESSFARFYLGKAAEAVETQLEMQAAN